MPEENFHQELNEQFRLPDSRGGDKLSNRNVQTDPLVLDSDRDTDTSTTNQQRAAYDRADGFPRKAREEENLESTKKELHVPTNSSAADDLSKDRHFQQNSVLRPGSVYKNPTGEIKLPRYKSTLD